MNVSVVKKQMDLKINDLGSNESFHNHLKDIISNI